uniref:Uncharacterized protein n=1 Tax=Salix viminalis TaxID=40686 RepID=A0A6N2NF83_SALVM
MSKMINKGPLLSCETQNLMNNPTSISLARFSSSANSAADTASHKTAGSEVAGAIAGTEYLSSVEKLKPKLQWEKNSGRIFSSTLMIQKSITQCSSLQEARLGEQPYDHHLLISLHVSGNEWQRHPFAMPRQQLPPLKAHQQQPAFTEDKAFHPIILKKTISV